MQESIRWKLSRHPGVLKQILGKGTPVAALLPPPPPPPPGSDTQTQGVGTPGAKWEAEFCYHFLISSSSAALVPFTDRSIRHQIPLHPSASGQSFHWPDWDSKELKDNLMIDSESQKLALFVWMVWVRHRWRCSLCTTFKSVGRNVRPFGCQR